MKYHRAIGFPKSLILPEGKFWLVWSDHAYLKFQSLFDSLSVPKYETVNADTIIEIHTKNDVDCENFVTRTVFTETEDVITCFKLIGKKRLLVISFWMNNKDDNHETLDKSKYDLPDNYNSKEIDFIYGGHL